MSLNTLNLLEKEYDIALPDKGIQIIRVTGVGMRKLMGKDGLADNDNREAMILATIETAKIMDNFVVAYYHGNEVSFVLTDIITENTQPWLGNHIQGLVSITSSSVAAHYSILLSEYKKKLMIGTFRARVFELYGLGATIGNYINTRITQGIGRYTSELYSQHFTGNSNTIANAQRKLWEANIEMKKEFMYGDIICKPGLHYTRISPLDIGFSQITEFIDRIIENRREYRANQSND